MPTDSWVNWGDFVGANEEQLKAYDAKVTQSQESQQAAMQQALARLGSAYDAESGDVEKLYRDQTAELYDPKSTYNNPTAAGQGTTTPGQGGRMDAVSGSPYPSGLGLQGDGMRVGGASGGSGGGGMQRTDQRSLDSYAALMQSQNDAEKNAFRGFQAAEAPAWQNALYGARTQYEDPWAGLQEKVDPLKARNEERQTRAKTAYETAEAARRAQAGTTTKPTGTDADGNPTYGQQVDPGPRNTAINPPAVKKVRAY